MKGINAETEKVFKQLSELSWVKNYTLIGGTALSLQINHRISEDLDFCKWKRDKNDKPEVEIGEIESDLHAIGI